MLNFSGFKLQLWDNWSGKTKCVRGQQQDSHTHLNKHPVYLLHHTLIFHHKMLLPERLLPTFVSWNKCLGLNSSISSVVCLLLLSLLIVHFELQSVCLCFCNVISQVREEEKGMGSVPLLQVPFSWATNTLTYIPFPSAAEQRPPPRDDFTSVCWAWALALALALPLWACWGNRGPNPEPQSRDLWARCRTETAQQWAVESFMWKSFGLHIDSIWRWTEK